MCSSIYTKLIRLFILLVLTISVASSEGENTLPSIKGIQPGCSIRFVESVFGDRFSSGKSFLGYWYSFRTDELKEDFLIVHVDSPSSKIVNRVTGTSIRFGKHHLVAAECDGKKVRSLLGKPDDLKIAEYDGPRRIETWVYQENEFNVEFIFENEELKQISIFDTRRIEQLRSFSSWLSAS